MEDNKVTQTDLGALGPEEDWRCFEYDGALIQFIPDIKIKGTGVVRKADGTIKREKK